MAQNGNGWKQWMAQAAMTIVLTALAAFGGIRAGLSEAKEKLATVEARQVSYQIATDRRLDRMEDKIDRLVERRRDAR